MPNVAKCGYCALYIKGHNFTALYNSGEFFLLPISFFTKKRLIKLMEYDNMEYDSILIMALYFESVTCCSKSNLATLCKLHTGCDSSSGDTSMTICFDLPGNRVYTSDDSGLKCLKSV